MAKTIEMAKKAWADKMRFAGPRWKAGVEAGKGFWKKGVAEFLGVSEGSIDPTRVSAYEAGVGRVSADDFARAVSGKEEKYGRKLLEGLTV